MTGGLDASHRCARRLGELDRDPFSIQISTQIDQNKPFASVGCVDPALSAMARAHTLTPLPAVLRAYLVYFLPSMLACYSYIVCLSPVCALCEVVDAVKSSMERSISTNQHCCTSIFLGSYATTRPKTCTSQRLRDLFKINDLE
jgi:hypothetical protein